MLVQSQKGIVHLGLLVLLLLGLVAGVYLVQHPQIFKPKAAGDILWLVDENGQKLSPKEGTDVFEVSSQQIHIKITQPKWQASLPGLVTTVLAQQSTPGCADSDGKVYDGDKVIKECVGWDGKGANVNTQCIDRRYAYYYSSCTAKDIGTSSPTDPQRPAGQTGQPAQPQVDNTTPGITGASWDQQGDFLTITGTNFGNQAGTVYYSRGGSEQIPSRSVSSWSAGSVKIGAEIPLGSTKSAENMISGGNYLKVCRTDGKCSGYWSPIPERKFRVDVPTAPKDAPQGAPAKPAEVTEATDKMRISMDQSKLDSDEVCTEDTDPQKHCLKFTPGDLAARALIGKDYVDWWLANKPGEIQTIYVRFVSNKGTPKDESIKVSIVRPQPTVQPAGQGGPARSTPPSPTPAGGPAKKLACPIDDGGACVNESLKTVGNNLTCAGIDESNTYSCPNPAYPTCLTGVSCKSSAPAGGPAKKLACPIDDGGACVNESLKTVGNNLTCAGIDESNTYSCSNPAYPTCLTDTTCESVSTPTPTPTTTPTPAPTVTPTTTGGGAVPTPTPTPGGGQGSPDNPELFGINVQNNTDKQVTVQKINVEFSYGVDILGFRLFPKLINIMTDDRGFRGPVVLDPNKYISLIPGAICTESEANQNKEKVVRVDYIMANAPYIARGKYQCGGGSGIVTIP